MSRRVLMSHNRGALQCGKLDSGIEITIQTLFPQVIIYLQRPTCSLDLRVDRFRLLFQVAFALLSSSLGKYLCVGSSLKWDLPGQVKVQRFGTFYWKFRDGVLETSKWQQLWNCACFINDCPGEIFLARKLSRGCEDYSTLISPLVNDCYVSPNILQTSARKSKLLLPLRIRY